MGKIFSVFYKKTVRVYSFVLVIIGLIGVVLVFSFSKPETRTDSLLKSEPKTLHVVTNVEIPENADFAGERVPIENFDVKEALERELLINAYWQSQTMILLKRTNRYFGIIEPILKKYQVPDDFKFLVLAESGLSNVSSPAGASGFWQFLPETAKELGLEVNEEVDERYHLEKSTDAACRLLLSFYSVYKNWTMAAASYNVGKQGLYKQVKRQYTDNYYDILLNDETARYIYRIVALKTIYKNPLKYGFDIPKDTYYPPIPYTEVTIDAPIPDLAKFAFSKGTNYKLLKILNPWFRNNVLTNLSKKSYVIKIPKPGFRNFKNETPAEDIERIEKQSEEVGK